MNHPGALTIDDNTQLIACHVGNIRKACENILRSNALGDHHATTQIVPAILVDGLAIDTLASQLIGQPTLRKESLPCSLPLANSPSSASLPSSSALSSSPPAAAPFYPA